MRLPGWDACPAWGPADVAGVPLDHSDGDRKLSTWKDEPAAQVARRRAGRAGRAGCRAGQARTAPAAISGGGRPVRSVRVVAGSMPTHGRPTRPSATGWCVCCAATRPTPRSPASATGSPTSRGPPCRRRARRRRRARPDPASDVGLLGGAGATRLRPGTGTGAGIGVRGTGFDRKIRRPMLLGAEGKRGAREVVARPGVRFPPVGFPHATDPARRLANARSGLLQS